MEPTTNFPSTSSGSRKGKRGVKTTSLVELTPRIIIHKVIQHSKDPRSPRLIKYLQELRRSFSSSNIKLWMDLRTKGGLQAVEAVVGNCVKLKMAKENGVDSEEFRHDVFVTCLSILGNSYSVDYLARKEVESSGFLETLHYLLRVPRIGFEDFSDKDSSSLPQLPPLASIQCDVKAKAVKCIANLANDSTCRGVILKSGIGISILKMLECLVLYYNQEKVKKEGEESCDDGENPDLSECSKASVRSIRILSSSNCGEEAKSHLIRFGAVTTIGRLLTWARGDEFQIDILRSLANLTDKMRLLPNDQIEELVSEDSGNLLLKTLIGTFAACNLESKVFNPAIRCLTNLASNTRIAEQMGRKQIFNVALEKLKFTTSDKSAAEICRLLMALTKHSSVNRMVLHNCLEIWTTLGILRSPNLEEYHRWLLHVYENVYQAPLKALLANGLIGLVHDHFRKELEDCDYLKLKCKIMSLEDNSCKVHVDGCHFIPTYRCESPTYQQIQEEVTIRMKIKDSSRQTTSTMETDSSSASSGIDSLSSPSSSPTRSWCSDDSGSELGIPSRSRISDSPSSASSVSDDEGCYSPIYSTLSLSPVYSDDGTLEPTHEHVSLDDSSWRDNPKPAKFPKLDCIPLASDDQVEAIPPGKKMDLLKNKCKKIVVMLRILQKITYLSPMPQDMIQVVPILLSFIVRGVVSLTPQKYKYQDFSQDAEMVKLGQMSFNFSYKVLKAIFLDIHFFPGIVKNGTPGILSRLLPWNKPLTDFGNHQENIAALLETLSGKTNDTLGWRQGHLMRTLLVEKNEEEVDTASLSIPLLFRKNDHALRNFESKGGCWTRIFEILMRSDAMRLSAFQDCILSLSTLCATIGMNYDNSDAQRRPMLLVLDAESCTRLDQIVQFIDEGVNEKEASSMEEGKVKINLDDGSCAVISKDLLTESSPVFAAMFDGHFREAGSQIVRINNVSKETLKTLLGQLQMMSTPTCNQRLQQGDSRRDLMNFDLSTLFEIVSLSDQFLLDGIYERTLNTLLFYYICPYSAPGIYREAVKLSTLCKPRSHVQGWDMDLTFLVLRYLLVGDLSMACRTSAFRKIFDTVPSANVVGDLRALVEFYSTRPSR